MLNLDPSLLNQDKIRRERRKRWLKLTIVPVIVFALVFLFFIRTTIYNLIVGPSFKGGDYGAPSVLTSMQKIGNLLEPYLSYYNSGYIKLMEAEKSEDLIEAENDFRESMKHNPPESMLCSIYTNLSYSIELQGDIASEAKTYDEALVFYNKAESVLYENGCASKEDGKKGKDELADSAKERVIKKREKTVSSANNEKNSDSSDDDNTPSEISDSDLEAVEELNINSINGGVQTFHRRMSDTKTDRSSLPRI